MAKLRGWCRIESSIWKLDDCLHAIRRCWGKNERAESAVRCPAASTVYQVSRLDAPPLQLNVLMSSEIPATILELSHHLRTNKISPTEVTRSVLDRIERLNPPLGAFITVMADSAMADARTAEIEIGAGRWRGPLHGVPIALKDLIDTAGVRT